MKLPELKLISFSICPYAQRARILLLEKDIPHQVEYIDIAKPPEWFKALSPLGKVPVLLVDGKPLFESMVIVEYLDEITPGSLYPSDPFEKAQNRAWIEYGNEVLGLTHQLFTTSGEKRFGELGQQLDERLQTLEENLGEGPFFNGESFCIIDAVYAPIFRFHHAMHKYEDHGFFDEKPRLRHWSKRLLAWPSVIECVPASYVSDLENFIRSKQGVFARRLQTLRKN